MRLDRFKDLVDQLKAHHEDQTGPVQAVKDQAPLRDLVSQWPQCKRESKLRGADDGDAWSAVEVDIEDLAHRLCCGWYSAQRLLRRAQQLGAIYPDGTVQDRVQEYLEKREAYAIATAVVIKEEGGTTKKKST